MPYPANRRLAREQAVPLACGAVFIAIYFLALASGWPTLGFTSDSWSYYELARTFETGDPMRFNTLRSYIPAVREYSASFPLGYPFLLHIAHQWLGAAPEVGVQLNVLAAVLTPFVAASLSNALRLGRVSGFACGTMLVVSSPYVGGVLSAGSIPAAILLILAGLRLVLQSQDGARVLWLAMGGLVLGWAALVRFDALFFALPLAGYVALVSRRPAPVALYLLGVVLGVAPWLIYCLLHFGTPLFSDNSWVALAAIPAYVTDYRPGLSQTLFTEPALWTQKALHNAYWLARGGFRAMKNYPAIFLLAAALPFLWKGPAGSAVLRGVAFIAVACIALLPQLATGYHDGRYYALVLFTACLAAFAGISQGREKQLLGMPAPMLLLVAAVLANGLLTAFGLLPEARSVEAQRTQAAAEERMLASLAKCHATEPGTLYLFPGPLAARYGALYGQRTGIIPRNWQQLDALTRERFGREYGPYRAISLDPAAIASCQSSSKAFS